MSLARVVFVLALAWSVPSAAEERDHDRELGGHLFQYPTLQRSAFIDTNFSLQQAVALYRATPGVLALLGNRDLALIGVLERTNFTLRVLDFLAVDLAATGSGVTGQTGPSLVVAGAKFSVETEAGLLVRALRSEKSGTQVTFRGFGGYSYGRSLTMLPLLGLAADPSLLSVGDILSGRIVELVVVPRTEWTAGGGVAAAQALGKVFSLQGSVNGRYVWGTEHPYDPVTDTRTDEATSTWAFTGGLALGIDLASLRIPVAVLGEYSFLFGQTTEVIGDTQLRLSTIGAGLYYSGRDDLQLGFAASVVVNGERIRTRAVTRTLELSGDATLYSAQFVFRYFW